MCGNSSEGTGEELGAPEPQNGRPGVLITTETASFFPFPHKELKNNPLFFHNENFQHTVSTCSVGRDTGWCTTHSSTVLNEWPGCWQKLELPTVSTSYFPICLCGAGLSDCVVPIVNTAIPAVLTGSLRVSKKSHILFFYKLYCCCKTVVCCISGRVTNACYI